MSEEDQKAIIVLTGEEIDAAIHGLEMAGVGMDEDQFRDWFGDVYQKLFEIDPDPDDTYRVK